ncbi:MAG: sulfotransferase [Anaerolineales bacterium]|nr:sulfotransferase [Anaerolineales bacterium]
METAKLKRAIQQPGAAVEYLWHRAFSVFGHNDYKRFIVLGRPRIGSTWLISLLDSHPNIYARGEIFLKLNGRDYREILNRTFCKQPPHVKAVGFKIFYLQPYDNKDCGIWPELIEMRQVQVIHLKRKNILQTLLSKKISQQTKIAKATKGNQLKDIQKRKVELSYETYLQDIQERKVEFTSEELVTEFNTLKRLEAEFDDKFRSHPLLTVYYEDLVSRLNAEMETITNFLGLPFYPPKSQYVKLNPENPSNLIANYESLKREFSGTEWAQFFEEEMTA